MVYLHKVFIYCNLILASIECTPHLGGPTSQKAALEFRAKSSDSDRNRVPGLQLSANYLPSRRLGVAVPTGISSKAHVFSHSHTHCPPPLVGCASQGTGPENHSLATLQALLGPSVSLA